MAQMLNLQQQKTGGTNPDEIGESSCQLWWVL